MKLVDLMQRLDISDDADMTTLQNAAQDCAVINGIYYRAQDVQPGGLFVAIKGFAADGHDYIAQAVDRGAVAVVCEHPPAVDAVVLPVINSRKALATLAADFYGRPSEHMTVIGITGTNGKTTTSYLIESILQAAGLRTGVIGTINYRYGGRIFDNPVTTPESLDLQRILADMWAAGVTHAVMEVSSHALDLFRVHGCAFDIGVFTNFSQDHLDYHQDMARYWACKQRLFSESLPASAAIKATRAVINCQDPKGRELTGDLTVPFLTTGQGAGYDIGVFSARFDLDGITARLRTPQGEMEMHSPLVGRHNLENILNAAGAGISLELPPETIGTGIGRLQSVPGRLERVPNAQQRYVYVDYAHTPDALENALLALRGLTAERIVCVFGCGGDRDRAKRPQMGAIAGRLCDLAVVTSDNPRTEAPDQIIQSIVEGVESVCKVRYTPAELADGFNSKGYVVEPDRRQAIRLAIGVSRPGDTILIAGKGHEPYQIVGQKRLPFNDRQEAAQAMAG